MSSPAPKPSAPMPFNLFRGLADEIRVQAHLGAMNLKDRARPWLDKADTVAHELLKRGRDRSGLSSGDAVAAAGRRPETRKG